MSRAKKEVKPQLFKHKHCPICSIPIPMDKEFCSPACEEKYKKAARRQRYSFVITLLLFPIIFILLLLVNVFRR
jgi:predicted nucleic acid-binding Zn ribbon protein